ncbi:MAG: gliding motility-associated C-terminal domain-containing protein [Flavobacterium sp.]
MTKLPATKFSYLILAFLFSIATFAAALPDFTISATSTPQTCLGNGSITFSTAGTTAGATLDYRIYKLPNLTTPILTVTSGPLINLTAGDYKIIATQTLGAEQNTAETTVNIANLGAELNFTLTPQNVRCGNDGKITVNVTTGTATQYEITAGPVTKPLQASNIFTGLPAGQYQVRVHDVCGDASVVTITLGTAQPHIAIDGVTFESGILPSCNTIEVSNFFGTLGGYEIFYPLTFVYSIMPPGGGSPITQTVTINSGTNAGAELTTTIPFYHNQSYFYNLKVTDACGNVYNRNNNAVNQKLTVNVNDEIEACGDNKFGIGLANFRPPYTVTFTSPTPASFMANPAAYNPSHPTFSDTAVYGAEGNSVPEGTYSVLITDACGRTAAKTFEVTDPDLTPGVSAEVDGCSPTGEITITSNSNIVLVKVMVAPPAYSAGPYPIDISSQIAGDELVIQNAPLGYYQFEITDECGGPYTKDVTVQVTGTDPNMTVIQRPGCAVGMGSIRLSINPSNTFTSVKITQSPPEFSTSFPVDVSSNIHGFNFSMNSLPAGTYTFETIDNCGTVRNRQIVIDGYQVTVNDIEVTPLCLSFQLKPLHTSNGTYTASYWLQKYDPINMTWGHPAGTGTPYVDGTLPSGTNSLPININVNNINLQYLGEFRVVKVFYTFSNGMTANQRCVEYINTFTYDGKPSIVDTHTFPCAGGLMEVAVEAVGVQPLVYRITEKNGGPFVVNNGTSSLFSGLEPATYNFQLTDNCGNLRNTVITINAVDPIVITQTGQCAESPVSLSVPAFSFLSFQWYKQGAPGTILSTTASLDFPSFDPITQAGTYVLQISSATSTCLNQNITHTVNALPQPNAGQDAATSVCNTGTTINVASLLTSAHDAGGTWTDMSSTGQFTGTTFSTAGMAAGTYQFKYSVAGSCSQTDDAIISVTLKNKPAAPVVTPLAALCEGTGGQLVTATIPNATYQWTGPDSYSSADQSPIFTNFTTAMAGTYTVRATVDGCTSDATSVTVTVNAIPQFTVDGAALLCPDQSTTLTVNPSNFSNTAPNVTYTWYEGTNLLPGVNSYAIEVFNPGTYSVVIDNSGCASQPVIHTITENAINTPIDLTHGCENDAYIVRVTNADAFPNTNFAWTGPEGYTGNGNAIDISGMAAGTYSLIITNTDGCTAGNSADVINTYCKIPRGISPNGDGDNDAFDLTNFNVEEIKIFNRYGLQVYEKKGYIKDWHGQSDKGDLPAGTYYYVLRMAGGREKTGWVYLQLNE